MLNISLLGRGSVTWNAQALGAPPRPKVFSLLAYLVLHDAAQRKYIAADLWPESSDEEARANLRRHLQYLRAWLPSGIEWIESSGAALRMNRHGPWRCDATEFSRRLEDPQKRDEAVELYGGDLCESLDEAWLDEPRRQLSEQFAGTLIDLATSARARREYDRAAQYAARLLAYDPWREDAVRQLMLAHYESNDRTSALHAFEIFAERLRAELGTEPSAETKAIFEAVRRDVPPAGSVVTLSPRASAPHDMILVGRDRELGALRGAFDEACAGQLVAAFAVGEAGIGKSRLLREFMVECESRGASVAAGNVPQPERNPYQPFVSVVRALAPLAHSVEIDDVWIYALDPMLGSNVGKRKLPKLEPARERWRLFEAVAVLLEAVSRRRPLCIVLEDLHWAGEGTLELLRYLLRRLRSSRSLFALSFRDDETHVCREVGALRREIAGEHRTFDIALHKLTEENVRTLVSRQFAQRSAEAKNLWKRSGGNPFFLSALLAAPAADDAFLQETLERRIAALEARAQELAAIAAVCAEFDLELLGQVTGWDEAALTDALDELTAGRVLTMRLRDGRSRFSFAHELLEAAFYARISAAERPVHHRRVARVMERLYDRAADEVPTLLAHHWDEAGDGDRAAGYYLAVARRAVRLCAFFDAKAPLERCLQLARDSQVRFDASLLGEEIASIEGDREAQRVYLEQAMAARPEPAFDERCTLLRRRLDLANVISDREKEEQLVTELRTLAREHKSVEWEASALEADARRLRTMGRFTEEEERFAQLRALVREDPQRFSGAYLAHADSLIYRNRIPEARRYLDQLAAFEECLDPRTAIRMLMTYSRAALVEQRYEEMYSFAKRALDLSVKIGDREGEALALHNVANGTVYQFDIERTVDAFSRATTIYEQLGHRVGLASIAVDFGLFQTETGALKQAEILFAQALRIAQEINFPWVLCVANVNASYCARLAENFTLAGERGERALQVATSMQSPQLESAALGTLGTALFGAGDLPKAQALIERAVQLRRGSHATPRLGDNLCALSAVYVARANIPKAVLAADEFMEMYSQNDAIAPQPVEWLLTAASVYRAADFTDRAAKLVKEARGVFARRSARFLDENARAAYAALPFNRELNALTVSLRR